MDACGHVGAFYAVVPHGVLVSLFGAVGVLVCAALAVGVHRFRHDITPAQRAGSFDVRRKRCATC